MNAQGEVLHQVDWRGIDPSGWNNTYFYNQPALESHLDRALRDMPDVMVRRGVDAAVVSQDDEGVEATITPIDGGETETVRASWVISAEGANSATRDKLDIEWNDLGYFFDWLVVDVVPQPGVEITHLAKQICDPVRPTTVVPAGPGRRRWEFMRLEGESAAELTRPEKIWELLEPFGVRADNSEMERGVIYTFNSGWASKWREGRVFLMGDAAHQMPPFAGQGLAAGFRDALNLSWKLDLVLRGKADKGLLDTYATERQRHVADFIDFSMSLGQIICVLDPEAAAARDAEMTAALRAGREAEPPPAPRLGEGLHHGDTGGVLSRQGQITTSDHREPVRFDDVFGAGALILRAGAEPPTSVIVESLLELGIRTVSVAADFTDVHGTYGAWFDELDADAVLVRPDFYVYGTASSAAVANLPYGSQMRSRE